MNEEIKRKIEESLKSFIKLCQTEAYYPGVRIVINEAVLEERKENNNRRMESLYENSLNRFEIPWKDRRV